MSWLIYFPKKNLSTTNNFLFIKNKEKIAKKALHFFFLDSDWSEHKTQPPCKSSLYFNKQPLKAILHRFFLDEAKSAFEALDVGSRICHNPWFFLFCFASSLGREAMFFCDVYNWKTANLNNKSLRERKKKTLSSQNSSVAGPTLGFALIDLSFSSWQKE